jgi:WASH complex subunit strumpellin
MFETLDEIVALQASKLKELPARVEKTSLKTFVHLAVIIYTRFIQLDERYQLAKCTHAVSVFTEGLLAMEKTLVGVIEVDPKQLLEGAKF